MKIASPAFGLISGFSTSIGLLPHIFVLCFILIGGVSQLLAPLIIFTIGAKLLGEWIFWDQCKKRQTPLYSAIVSHPNVWISLIIMSADALLDAMLIFTALKTSLSPALVLLTLLASQAIFSPIQGLLSDYYSQKKSLIFSFVVGTLALLAVGEIPLNSTVRVAETYSFISLFGLSSFAPSVQMVFVLFAKGTFANATVIARAAIAEVAKKEALKGYTK